MKALFHFLIFFLSLAICQAQKVKKTSGAFSLGISKNYYFNEKTSSARKDYQLTYSKERRQVIVQYSRRQLSEYMILKNKDLCDNIGIVVFRTYLLLAYNYSIYNKSGITISVGPHIRYLKGSELASCYHDGWWKEPHYRVLKTIEPGLNINCQFFPLKKKVVRNFGLSTNIVLVTRGSNIIHMGLLYKFKFKKNEKA